MNPALLVVAGLKMLVMLFGDGEAELGSILITLLPELLLEPPLLVTLFTVSWLPLGAVVAAAAAPTAAGVLGEAALPKELPKPPKPKGVLLPPMGVPALVLKLAKLNALETGSTLGAA